MLLCFPLFCLVIDVFQQCIWNIRLLFNPLPFCSLLPGTVSNKMLSVHVQKNWCLKNILDGVLITYTFFHMQCYCGSASYFISGIIQGAATKFNVMYDITTESLPVFRSTYVHVRICYCRFSCTRNRIK